MHRVLARTQRLVAHGFGVAALAYASSSSLFGMVLAIALDLALRGHRALAHP